MAVGADAGRFSSMGVLLVMRLRVLYDFKKKMSIEKKTGIHGTSPIDCRLVSQELYKKDRTLWEKLPRLVQGNYNSVSLYEQAIDAYSARFDESAVYIRHCKKCSPA